MNDTGLFLALLALAFVLGMLVDSTIVWQALRRSRRRFMEQQRKEMESLKAESERRSRILENWHRLATEERNDADWWKDEE